MPHKYTLRTALLAAALTVTGAAQAQVHDNSQAILDILVQKGVLTAGEAQQVNDAAAKKLGGDDVYTNPADKFLKKLTLTGRFQVQFMDAGTSIDGFQNAAPATLPAHPVASEHFILRRIYLGTAVNFANGFSGVVNYDFANSSFDAAYIDWKQSDLLSVDVGFKKVPFAYEEVTSSGSLKAIERSPITRYFDEPNNGRRLGAASYRTGIFASGSQDGWFYSVAVTNPERNEYAGDAGGGSTPTVNAVNGNGGVGNYSNATNNNLAFYGWGGYGGTLDTGSGIPAITYKAGLEGGSLPDQGGPGASVGVGNNLTIMGAYVDASAGDFNLQAEYMTSKDDNSVVKRGVVSSAKPNGFWIQPSYYVIPKVLEGVLRYSYVDSDDRGVAISDGIRGATSGGTMNKMDELYVGGNWYIDGNDVKLQFGYIHGSSKDPLIPATATGVVATGTAIKASTDGFRTQMQVNF